MAKHLKFDVEAQREILAGFDEVADAVGATMGPRGQTVVLSRPAGAPLVTKDGVTVARDIVLANRWRNEGAKLIQQVAQQTNTEAGDGTTAATVLARALFREGLKRVAAGADRRAVERGIASAVGAAVAALRELATPVDRNDLAMLTHVATVAANGDEAIGRVIAEAVQGVGLEGVITLDQSPTAETTFQIAEGMQFERGMIAPIFMTHPTAREARYAPCNVFVTDRRMIDDRQMFEFLQAYVAKAGKTPLLIVAEDCEGAALQMLATNQGKSIWVVPVRTPGAGQGKKEEIEDIAIFCGAKPYMVQTGDDPAKLDLAHLGSADEVRVSQHRTTIIGGHGAKLRLEARQEELRAALREPEIKDFVKAQLERRLAMLTASVAVIKIGANVHSKLLEKRDRVEDSVNATLGALKEGVVPGGGAALTRCLPAVERFAARCEGDERVGALIVARALTVPLECIAANAGANAAEVVRCVRALGGDLAPVWWAQWMPLELLHRLRPEQAILRAGLPLRDAVRWGYDASCDRYTHLPGAGILDPAKVVRMSLENAAELAGLMLTMAALNVELPEGMAVPAGPGLPVVARG